MKLKIVNEHLAGHLWQAWQHQISRAHGRYKVPKEWEEFLEKLKKLYASTDEYPSLWEIEDEMIELLARAIDDFFVLETLRHFDSDDYLAEDDDLNRLYDQMTGKYSRGYRTYLSRRH